MLRTLLLEDSSQDAEIIRELLIDSGFDFEMDCAELEKEFISFLGRHTYDIILSDFKLSGFDAFTALRWAKEICPEVPFICVTGSIGEETAVELIKHGAVDYVLKDKLTKLPLAIKRAVGEAKEKQLRQQAEIALLESEIKYRTLIDQARDSIMLHEVSNEGVVVIRDANTAALQMHGYSREEIIGKDVSFLDAEISETLVTERLNRIEGSVGKKTLFEARHRRKDGSVFDIEVSVQEIVIDSKIMLLDISRDISERKRVEEALRESEGFLSSIIENIPDMIFVKNAKDLSFVKFNKAGEDLLGVSRETLMGNDGLYLFTKEQAENFREKDRVVLNSKRMLDIPEEQILTKNNGTRVLHTQKIPLLDKNGEAKYLLGISDDITERKHLQEQLLQSQKMDAIGTLTGGIAHDFNNLLTVILGNSNIAMNEIDKKSQTYKEIKEINIAAARAASLTRQLLLYSRKQPMGFYTLNINTTVNDLVKMLERLLGEDTKIKLELGSDILSVKADLSNLEQVITNLCINARDAMPKGGTITIKTENLVLSEDESTSIEGSHPRDYIRLSIADTGIGMDNETIKHIFEPFFTTKGLGKGTGLGLSVVYGIIKAHNGWINVYSEPTHGTIFKIYLPATKSEAAVINEVKTEPKRLKGKGEHILIVEDDDAILAYMERILSKNNYNIHKAVSSKNAVEVFKENSKNIDIVITDMVLTDENGLDTIDKLKLIKNDIGVIICSGYLDDKSNFLEIQQKGYKFIQKPFEIANMLKTIRQILDTKR